MSSPDYEEDPLPPLLVMMIQVTPNPGSSSEVSEELEVDEIEQEGQFGIEMKCEPVDMNEVEAVGDIIDAKPDISSPAPVPGSSINLRRSKRLREVNAKEPEEASQQPTQVAKVFRARNPPRRTPIKGGRRTSRRTSSGGRGFTCNKCEHHFQRHQKEKHAEGGPTRDFICPTCGDAFISSRNLTRHKQARHSTDRPYKCPQCPARFKLGYHVNQHKVIHSNQRPFRCPDCGASFKAKSDLTAHLRRVHAGQRNNSCPVCKKAFKQASHLRRHVRTHSEGGKVHQKGGN